MANRLVSNVIIVDSAAGNTPIVNSISNSVGQMTKFHVNSVMFFGNDTTGRVQVTTTDTANVIIQLGGIFVSSTQFGQQQPLEDLKIPLLTAGTAWIYLA